MPGVPWHTQILADQLTLFQPGGTHYAHLITTGTPGFLDLPTALDGRTFKVFILAEPSGEWKVHQSDPHRDVSKFVEQTEK